MATEVFTLRVDLGDHPARAAGVHDARQCRVALVRGGASWPEVGTVQREVNVHRGYTAELGGMADTAAVDTRQLVLVCQSPSGSHPRATNALLPAQIAVSDRNEGGHRSNTAGDAKGNSRRGSSSVATLGAGRPGVLPASTTIAPSSRGAPVRQKVHGAAEVAPDGTRSALRLDPDDHASALQARFGCLQIPGYTPVTRAPVGQKAEATRRLPELPLQLRVGVLLARGSVVLSVHKRARHHGGDQICGIPVDSVDCTAHQVVGALRETRKHFPGSPYCMALRDGVPPPGVKDSCGLYVHLRASRGPLVGTDAADWRESSALRLSGARARSRGGQPCQAPPEAGCRVMGAAI